MSIKFFHVYTFFQAPCSSKSTTFIASTQDFGNLVCLEQTETCLSERRDPNVCYLISYLHWTVVKLIRNLYNIKLPNLLKTYPSGFPSQGKYS